MKIRHRESARGMADRLYLEYQSVIGQVVKSGNPGFMPLPGFSWTGRNEKALRFLVDLCLSDTEKAPVTTGATNDGVWVLPG